MKLTYSLLPLPQTSPTRSPRPPWLLKGFKKGKTTSNTYGSSHGVLGSSWLTQALGTRWAASKGLETTGSCPYKAALYHLWKVVEIRQFSWWLGKNKLCTYLKVQKDNPENWGLARLSWFLGKWWSKSSWKKFLGTGGECGDWEQPAWTY